MTARSFHRKLAVLSRIVPYAEFNRAENGLITYWDTQDQSGAVALVTNPALVLASRSVALKTIADYTLNANWANPSGQIARHSSGSVETLQQDGILAPGKTYQATITLANVTAGSVTITDGGAAISANEETTRTITSTGTDLIVTPTSDFDGDIDVSILLVQQTNIAASNMFPGVELLDNPNFTNWTGVPLNDTPTGWAKIGVDGVNNYITQNPTGKAQLVSDGTLVGLRQTKTTIGKRYKIVLDIATITSGALQLFSGATPILTNINTTGKTIVEYTAVGTTLIVYRFGVTDIAINSVSLTEAAPMNGDYTGVSLGIPSGTRLEYLVSSDGVNDNLSIDSAELNSFINWDNLSFDMWAIADTWAAGTDYLFNFGIDSNNYFRGYRTGANLIIEHKAGGTQKSVTKASGSPSGLFHFGGSIDTSGGGTITLLYNGLPGGTATGLGTMVGNLPSDETVIGAFNDSGSNSWAGDWGHPTLFNITLTNGDWIRRFEAGGV